MWYEFIISNMIKNVTILSQCMYKKLEKIILSLKIQSKTFKKEFEWILNVKIFKRTLKHC